MKKSMKVLTWLLTVSSLGSLAPVGAQGSSVSTDLTSLVTSQDRQTDYDESQATTISFQGQEATVTGQGASFSNQVLTIETAGTYILTGSGKDVQVKIAAQDSDSVHLVLQGLTLVGQGTLIEAESAEQVLLTLADQTQNRLEETLSDEDEATKATLHSEVSLTLNGQGDLTVIGLAKNAIESETDLKILGGTYSITATKHGVKSEGALYIEAANLTIDAGKDGLHAENEAQAERANVYLNPKALTISSQEDGVDAGNELLIAGGQIDIKESEEGLEARVIRQVAGDVTIKSSDDGVNASAGSSTSTDATETSDQAPAPNRENGMPPQAPGGGMPGGQEESDPSLEIIIEGGTLTIDAEGDGIDSNGTVSIKGGQVLVNGSVQGGNGALDASGEITITGGTVFAFGTADMMQGFAQGSTQASLATRISGTAGQTLQVLDANGTVLAEQTATKDFQSVIISLKALEADQSYTIKVGEQTQEVRAALVTPLMEIAGFR